MKRILLISLVLWLGAFAASSWGVCPEDPNDQGECDSMYIETWDKDVILPQRAGPYFVRVPIYLTTDTINADDRLGGMVIPLCYTHSNPSLYCSVSTYWNKTATVPGHPDLPRSIFRHIPVTDTDSIHNRMMDLNADYSGRDWDFVEFNLDGTSHFWLSMFAAGADEPWWDGSKVLTATITFKCEDTMTVCVDTCFWPPASRLALLDLAANSKIPRPGNETPSFEECFSFRTSDVREIPGDEESRPVEFSLSQNYPNPFNPYTNFRFTLAKPGRVKIEIFNIVGQRVRTLVDEQMKAGVYLADWDGKDERGNSVSSGIYFYRMEAGDFSDMKKMLLVK